ncbi:MAG TPA: ABC transporter ATP-binding protein [Flavisolibacter sp.]|nr:ABC transporter ATP-binding protein [Flavisolibacter sp.]
MKISLQNVGKRYNREWIFRNVTLELTPDKSYAITGPNGSGKSTLLQVIGGMIQHSEGSIIYPDTNGITNENLYKDVSITAPYLDVIEEMTLLEFLLFHNEFKPFLDGVNSNFIINAIGLEKDAGKQIRYYSSGMKQRVKLAQAIFSDTKLLLLDEPCSNLDQKGIELYHQLIKNFKRDRIIIISSNDEVEYNFSEVVIPISKYKTF